MSKSRGNIYYTDMLASEGYSMQEIRFFLIYGYYREKLYFSKEAMKTTVSTLRELKSLVNTIEQRAVSKRAFDSSISSSIKKVFTGDMDNDLHVKRAFDEVHRILSGVDVSALKSSEASGIITALRGIDEVLQVIF